MKLLTCAHCQKRSVTAGRTKAARAARSIGLCKRCYSTAGVRTARRLALKLPEDGRVPPVKLQKAPPVKATNGFFATFAAVETMTALLGELADHAKGIEQISRELLPEMVRRVDEAKRRYAEMTGALHSSTARIREMNADLRRQVTSSRTLRTQLATTRSRLVPSEPTRGAE